VIKFQSEDGPQIGIFHKIKAKYKENEHLNVPVLFLLEEDEFICELEVLLLTNRIFSKKELSGKFKYLPHQWLWTPMVETTKLILIDIDSVVGGCFQYKEDEFFWIASPEISNFFIGKGPSLVEPPDHRFLM
jgi:hypothetical protein